MSKGKINESFWYIRTLFPYLSHQIHKALMSISSGIILILSPTDCTANTANILIPSRKIIDYHRLLEQKKNHNLQYSLINIPSQNKQESPKNANNNILDHIALLKERLRTDINTFDNTNLETKIPLPNNLKPNVCVKEKKLIPPRKNINNLKDTNHRLKIKNNQEIKNIHHKKNNHAYTVSNKNTSNYLFPKTIENNQRKLRKYFWPVTGNIVNFKKNNNGVDILTPPNTSIKAAADGMVIYVGNDLVELGNTILIRHDDSIVTVYSHIDTPYVQKGQKVSRGHTIGLSGKSGNAQHPQVHFELRKNAIAMDPIKFLEEKIP
ncbi:M23 family metallopeptidase [Candidatus Liberibacter asiaticus]|nr:M23 family metallopeptidase [Candidatus Liberibacter asiaticus]WGV39265.1 M23 family metallopeptidase [Candidatus Liberibacter asiaticus]